ncbi:hypothetical protein QRN89_31530 [Streptomyces chengbuensis]|uniref:hypothetical protein n=1 Tax=Streptomyces TaxID=1883 RepID=UPI0025B373C1|nr:hypothetical protein [Streptomyces sp. HUAS CB01]WJY53938.1 hypothetical protein QRN89_31530 [Streptomyces sp. HUAS CB01]
MTHHQLTDEAKPPLTSVRQLTLRFSSTRRGARLARQLAAQQFTEWTGLSYDCDPASAVALVTADRWGCAVRDAHTKTVWAEMPLRTTGS